MVVCTVYQSSILINLIYFEGVLFDICNAPSYFSGNSSFKFSVKDSSVSFLHILNTVSANFSKGLVFNASNLLITAHLTFLTAFFLSPCAII